VIKTKAASFTSRCGEVGARTVFIIS